MANNWLVVQKASLRTSQIQLQQHLSIEPMTSEDLLTKELIKLAFHANQ